MTLHLVTLTSGRQYTVDDEELERLTSAGVLSGSTQVTPEVLDDELSDIIADPQSLTRAALGSLGIGSLPDATATVKGGIRLTGDLGGTATSPTVPALVDKASTTQVAADLAANATADRNRANHTGTQPVSTLATTGTKDATTFLRGDDTWAVPPGTGGGGGGTVVDATDTVKGIVELATQAEVVTGTSATTVVTPATLHGKDASTATKGLVRLALDTDALAGTDTTKALTPANAKAVSIEDRKRDNHTGTQLAATISDLTEVVQDLLSTTIVQGANIGVSYNDAAGTLEISADAPGIAEVNYANVPAGSTFVLKKAGTVWPARPSTRTDISFIWKGADPPPSVVTPPSTAGMYNDTDALGDMNFVR